MTPPEGGYRRYLRAKASVDARAIHPGVRAAVEEALRCLPADRMVRAVELGAGAGGGFRRWIHLLVPFRRVEFTVTDSDADLLRGYRKQVLAWIGEIEAGLHDGARLGYRDQALEVRFRRLFVPDETRVFREGGLGLLVAQSFWDLVPPGTALPLARRLLARGGVFYAALTFSGETRFEPTIPGDRAILARYHLSMDSAGGDSRAGEQLIAEFREPGSGFSELASARSDWRVVPEGRGYPGDERFFLETILGFIEKELRGAEGSAEWVAARRRQLREGTLSFTARQHDFAARRISDSR